MATEQRRMSFTPAAWKIRKNLNIIWIRVEIYIYLDSWLEKKSRNKEKALNLIGFKILKCKLRMNGNCHDYFEKNDKIYRKW